MSDLKIRIYHQGRADPGTTVTIPGGILRFASNMIPHKAKEALDEKGVDIEEIVRLSENPEAHGIVVEIEDHDKNERVVVSLE